MTKFSSKLKKLCFWPILSPISQSFKKKKKIFPENLALLSTTSHGILAPCQNLEKINDTIPRKCSDRRRRTEGRKDGQALFYRILPATAGVQ